MSHSSSEYENKNINEFVKLQRKANQQAAIQQAEKQVEWYTLVIKYRNLTIREALSYYDAMVVIKAISPLELARGELESLGMHVSSASIRRFTNWGNTKRDTIKQLTWQLDMEEYNTNREESYVAKCPCCERLIHPKRATWFIKPYYIASGFIKVCRGCSARFGDRHKLQCISVYHPQYMQCLNDHDVITAEKVFKEYVTRGIVFDSKIASWQEIADTYMDHVIGKLTCGMNRKKK